MKIHRGNFESNVLFLKKTKLLNKKQKILEIGSGNGAMVSYLKKQGYNITGTEVNPTYIDFAKKHFGVRLQKITTGKLPFSTESFDVVLSFDVFEHIPDSKQHLQDVKRILKKNGVYAFATPNKITNIPFEILKEMSFSKYKSYHPSLYTMGQLKNLLLSEEFTPKFYNISVMTNFFKQKLHKYTGAFGSFLLSIINLDELPLWLKTNFFVVGKMGRK